MIFDKTNRSTDLEAREIWEYALRFDLGVLRSVDLEALDCVQLFLRRHRGHLQRSPKLPHPAQLVGLDHTFIKKYLFIICTSFMYEFSNSLADRHLLRHILVALCLQEVNLALIKLVTQLYRLCHFSKSCSAMALVGIPFLAYRLQMLQEE